MVNNEFHHQQSKFTVGNRVCGVIYPYIGWTGVITGMKVVGNSYSIAVWWDKSNEPRHMANYYLPYYIRPIKSSIQPISLLISNSIELTENTDSTDLINNNNNNNNNNNKEVGPVFSCIDPEYLSRALIYQSRIAQFEAEGVIFNQQYSQVFFLFFSF